MQADTLGRGLNNVNARGNIQCLNLYINCQNWPVMSLWGYCRVWDNRVRVFPK